MLCAETRGHLYPLVAASPQREGEPLLLEDEERKKVVGITGNGLVSSPRAVRRMNSLLGLSVLFVWGECPLSVPRFSVQFHPLKLGPDW